MAVCKKGKDLLVLMFICFAPVGMARSMQKPITCLYRSSCGRRLSAMIRGAINDNFHVVDYDELSKEKTIEELMAEIMTKMEKVAEKKDAEN